MSCVALRAERHYLGRVAAVQGGTPVGGLAGRRPGIGVTSSPPGKKHNRHGQMTDNADVFLSYSRNDLQAANELRRQLRARGLSVFKDDDSIRSPVG